MTTSYKNIVVFGMGYVGAVTAAVLAAEGNSVIGVDTNEGKVATINKGETPVLEPGLKELIRASVDQGRLRATRDVAEAMTNADVVFVCVGTPSSHNGALDSSYVEAVCDDIGRYLGNASEFPVVVVRSTVLPNAIEETIVPRLESAAGKPIGDGYGFAINPEFLREGTSITDFYHPRFTIIGCAETETAEALIALYGFLNTKFIQTDRSAAPLVKYASNAFHALKVVFANEISALCGEVGADGVEVMRTFCMDTALNISDAYLRPGMAFGGSCLPKDARALNYFARSRDIDAPLLTGILSSNEAQKRRSLESILAHGRKRVGIFGLSFKAGTDDLRESPLVDMVEVLLGKGIQVAIYDGRVSLAHLVGTNRDYMEQHIPHIAALLKADIPTVIDTSEVVVIGNRDPDFTDIPRLLRQDQILIDLVGLFDNTQA